MAKARAKKSEYVSPARETLQTLAKLDRALSTAQGFAGSLGIHQYEFQGAKHLGNEVWDELEKMRWKIRKMLERQERPGGIL
jgi:hypothetical protein